MARSKALVTVYEVLYHVPDDHPAAHKGAAADGSFIHRTRNKGAADAFASGKKYCGQPAEVTSVQVPKHVAERWGAWWAC